MAITVQSVLAPGVHCIAFGYVVSCIPYASLYQSHLPQKKEKTPKTLPKKTNRPTILHQFLFCVFVTKGFILLVMHICHNRIPMTHFTTALWMITIVFAKYSNPKKDAQKCARILIFDHICFILGMFHDFPHFSASFWHR